MIASVQRSIDQWNIVRGNDLVSEPSSRQLITAAEILKAIADPHRLKLILRLAHSEMNVSELAELDKEKITTVSARLKVLLTARLLKRRREGQAIFYSIADAHVLNLVDNIIEHACDDSHAPTR